MPLLPISEGDKVLHIHSYEKQSSETTVKSKSEWSTVLENSNSVDNYDTLVRLDDPMLKAAQISYQRYQCVKILAFGNLERFSEEIINKIDDIYAMLSPEEKESSLSTLSACGALQKEPSFIAKCLKE